MVALPLRCPFCSAAVTVYVVAHDSASTVTVTAHDPELDYDARTEAVWPCPHCQKYNRAKLGGAFIDAKPGHRL